MIDHWSNVRTNCYTQAMIPLLKKYQLDRAEAVVYWLREETRNQEFVSSNPDFRY